MPIEASSFGPFVSVQLSARSRIQFAAYAASGLPRAGVAVCLSSGPATCMPGFGRLRGVRGMGRRRLTTIGGFRDLRRAGNNLVGEAGANLRELACVMPVAGPR